MTDDSDEIVNAQLVTKGLARVVKQVCVNFLASGMVDGNAVVTLAAPLNVAPKAARNTRSFMWRYGDVGPRRYLGTVSEL
jgi:hypothetical protein